LRQAGRHATAVEDTNPRLTHARIHADDGPVDHLLLRVDSDCIREPKNPHSAGTIYPLKLLNLVARG